MTVWFGMLVASSSLLFLEMQVHGSEKVSTEFVVHGASFISGEYYFTQSVSDCFRNCLAFVSAVLLSTYATVLLPDVSLNIPCLSFCKGMN